MTLDLRNSEQVRTLTQLAEFAKQKGYLDVYEETLEKIQYLVEEDLGVIYIQ